MRLRAAVLLVLSTLVLGVPPAEAGPAGPAGPAVRSDHGGPHPVTELVGQFPTPRVARRQDVLNISRWGYRFWGGGVGNDLVVTEVRGQLRYVDRAARSWKNLPPTCRRVPVARGVGAQCRIPRQFRGGRMFLEVFPRLGGDHVDGSTLPGRYRMWVLSDEGDDVVSTGRGADFVNGAFDDDTISTGPGADWVRAGIGTNRVSGGAGDDDLAGGDDRDTVSGGPGRDQVFGGTGDDLLIGGPDADTIGGGPGRDTAVRDASDHVYQCEVVRS